MITKAITSEEWMNMTSFEKANYELEYQKAELKHKDNIISKQNEKLTQKDEKIQKLEEKLRKNNIEVD